MKKKVRIFCAVWKEGKYYVAQCLNFEVSSFGKTKAAAVKNLQEAIELYLEDRPQVPKITSPTIVERDMMAYA